MSFSLDYIREKTTQYTKGALSEGILVSPEEDLANDSVHPKTGRDLETPSSFKEDMLQVWTVDLAIPDKEKSKISEIVDDVLKRNLPENLLEFME